jgi:hypothetical protein
VVICQALHAWWSTLSPDVQNPTPSSPNFRSNAHLKLCLYLNDIFVGRPFIFFQTAGVTPESASSPEQTRRPNDNHHSSASPTPPHTTTAATVPERPRNRAALVERAVEAAINTIALLRTIHETTGLARSSYTEFSSCRAALLVMLAQSVALGPGTPQPRLKAAVEMGMRLIRRMAAGNNVSTQSEASIIEALETAVRRLHAMQDARGVAGPGGAGDGKGETFVEINVRGEMDLGKTGYERFREWAAMWPVGAVGGGEPQQQHQQQEQHHPRQMQGDDSMRGLKRLDSRAVETATVPSPYPGMPSVPGVLGPPPDLEHSPDSARWMALMDNAGIRMDQQLDDLSLFGGFPELGALDGWSGLI